MTKKDKLINWAKKRFEEGKKVVLVSQFIVFTDMFDQPYLHLEKHSTTFKNLDNLKRVLGLYNDNLQEKILKTEFDNNVEEFKKFKVKLKCLNRSEIKSEDACIKGYYWKK